MDTSAKASAHLPKKAILGWIGGKSRMVKTLAAALPAHRTYVEVFAGAAWLLFYKPPSKVEVLNDLNGELVRLYRVVQHHLPEFLRLCTWLLGSREGFALLRDQDPVGLTDVQRAVRFYVLNRNAYAARMPRPSYAVGPHRAQKFNPYTIEQSLKAAHERLAPVTIENAHYADCIKRFDSKDTFFYCDPPYWNCEDYYGKGLFSKADFEQLQQTLGASKGKWLISINDVPQIRALFKGYNIMPVQTMYSVATKSVKPVQELLISNYDLPAVDKP